MGVGFRISDLGFRVKDLGLKGHGTAAAALRALPRHPAVPNS